MSESDPKIMKVVSGRSREYESDYLNGVANKTRIPVEQKVKRKKKKKNLKLEPVCVITPKKCHFRRLTIVTKVSKIKVKPFSNKKRQD